MDWKVESRILAALTAAFLLAFWMPVGAPRFDDGVQEGLALVHWYAREHVILCLLPAFLIAGAIAVFASQGAVIRHLGADANKIVAYGIASVSGTLLAVCSCTVLPLFGGLYKRGAGLGPAIAFLYSGSAINVLAIVMTAKVLGTELGIARAVGAVAFSVVIGLAMHLLYRREEAAKAQAGQGAIALPDEGHRSPLEVVLLFALMIGVLVFANWAPASAEDSAVWHVVYEGKWPLTAALALAFAALLVFRFGWNWRRVVAVALAVAGLALAFPDHPQIPFAMGVIGVAAIAATSSGEGQEWFEQSWGFAKLIRLAVFRLLVRHGPNGLSAGEVARRIGVPPPTLSHHLAHLERARLVRSRRVERRIFYAVDLEGTRRLLAFLTEDCCQGQPDLCGGLTQSTPSCKS